MHLIARPTLIIKCTVTVIPVANWGSFAVLITEMDGRGGFAVEVADGVEGFKRQMISVLMRMISEVLNFCDRVMKAGKQEAWSHSGISSLMDGLVIGV